MLRAHGGRSCSWWLCGSLVGAVLRVTATLDRTFISPSRQRNGTSPSLRSSSWEHSCSTFYLETFNFQTPRLFEPLGYAVAYEQKVYPHGIVKYIIVKNDQNPA
jgi:hypothetical protein